jgi:hypothetical protein
VLFGPVAEVYRETVTREIAACPGALPPLEAIVRGLQAAGDALAASSVLQGRVS